MDQPNNQELLPFSEKIYEFSRGLSRDKGAICAVVKSAWNKGKRLWAK